MGVFDPNKCLNKYGTIRLNSAGDIVDMYGTIRGSAQFDAAKVVDTYGNLGPMGAAAAIGYLNYPATTHVDTWTTDMQVISTNRQLTANATIGCLEGYSIVYGGVVNVAGFQFNVGGDATSLGEFLAGGKVILSGNSSAAGAASTIFPGGTLQLGLDPCALTGYIGFVPFAVQGTLNIYGANTSGLNKVASGTTVASTGVVNIEGCGTCGTGTLNFNNNGVAAGGVINMTNSYTVYGSAGMNGTINVNSGASIYLSALAYNGTINLNAGLTSPGNTTNGWKNASCVASPNLIIANGQQQGGKVFVSAAGGSIGSSAAGGTFDFSGTLSGTGPLLVTQSSQSSFSNSANAFGGTVYVDGGQTQPYGNVWSNATIRMRSGTLLPSSSVVTVNSIQSASPTDTAARILISTIGLIVKNQDPEPYYGTFAAVANSNFIIQAGNFQIASTTGTLTPAILLIQGSARVGGYGGSAKLGGPLTIAAATGGLSLLTKPSTLAVTTFTASSGFKVDIGPNYAASPGTYTILTRTTAGTNTIPTVGTNASGLTPTFSWSGNNLQMVLA